MKKKIILIIFGLILILIIGWVILGIIVTRHSCGGFIGATCPEGYFCRGSGGPYYPDQASICLPDKFPINLLKNY